MLMLPSYLNKAKSRYYTGQPVTPLETYFQPKCKPRVKKKKKKVSLREILISKLFYHLPLEVQFL